ncbi:MAG: gamma-glutamyl-gamma-aminobutyrate hydrolase family protein [Deltaproteobacteria bacterium]|jgi:putative glutamine amidotransferase|nr:gamma-glutamyl-gamma-aminobutyrate hydrolase family protein [Deltaproteobacteria bacterium]
MAWPKILITASQRFTDDWDGSELAQVRVSHHYCEAVELAGGLPLIVGNYAGAGPERIEGRGRPQPPPRSLAPLKGRAAAAMEVVDGLLLSGGGDVLLTDEDGFDAVREMDRDRDFWEAALLAAAFAQGKPVLGVCRGLQLMNLFLGGSLWRDVPTEHPAPLVHQQALRRTEATHAVSLAPDSLLAAICRATEIQVNSGHHQAVKTPAADLRVSGRSGDGLIEALEHRRRPFALGVQWHPESLAHHDPAAAALFGAFVAAAGGQAA